MLFKVPNEILEASISVIPIPDPTKFPAFTSPVQKISPVLLIPTPDKNPSGADNISLYLPPTWKVNLGSFVAIPTNPCAYILVNPRPELTSTHWDVGRFNKLPPSP